MTKGKKEKQELRKKFWNEVIGYFCDDIGYKVEIINDTQTRVHLAKRLRVDFYPCGEKIHWLEKNLWDKVTDIEKFIQEELPKHKPVKAEDKPINKLTIDSPMPIGKHKGTLIKHLPKAYLRYIYEMEYTSKEVMELLRENENLFM